MAPIKNETQDKANYVSYTRNVVYSIVSLATKEIGGIAGLSTGISFAKKGLGGKFIKGVRLEFDRNDRLFINVFVNVYFGYSVNDVAFKVQENIKRSVESMTDYRVDSVNVHVVGVVFDEEQEAAVI